MGRDNEGLKWEELLGIKEDDEVVCLIKVFGIESIMEKCRCFLFNVEICYVYRLLL